MKKLSFLILLLSIITFPCMALAQESAKVEVYGGYQLFHVPGMNLNGFLAGVEGRIAKHVGIVGDFGFGRKSLSELGVSVSGKEYTLLVGPRFGGGSDKFRIFGEVLFGLNRASAGTDVLGTSVGVGINGFAMAFGGGLDLSLNKRIAIRPAEFDIMKSHFTVLGESGWETDYRYSGGIVFKFGSSK